MAKRRKKKWKPKSPKEAISFLISLFVVFLCSISFIVTYQEKYGTLPSWDDLMGHFGLSHETVMEIPKEVLQTGTSVHFIGTSRCNFNFKQWKKLFD